MAVGHFKCDLGILCKEIQQHTGQKNENTAAVEYNEDGKSQAFSHEITKIF